MSLFRGRRLRARLQRDGSPRSTFPAGLVEILKTACHKIAAELSSQSVRKFMPVFWIGY
jgi:hypothetical protein